MMYDKVKLKKNLNLILKPLILKYSEIGEVK